MDRKKPLPMAQRAALGRLVERHGLAAVAARLDVPRTTLARAHAGHGLGRCTRIAMAAVLASSARP